MLSITLILDGVGAAVAATHVEEHAGSHVVAATDAVPSTAAESMPCHQLQHAASLAAHDGHAGGEALDEPDQDASDCCKGGVCQCACMHAAQVDFIGIALRAVQVHGIRSIRRLPLAHAAPASPRLIRPPIG